jgi:formylglycine-generating enzyme required for sulfatase activity
MGFYDNNSNGVTHPVGTKIPNSWGLYDMHGNVAEWCNDFYVADYPIEGVVDPVGPEAGTAHVIRGGGWNSFPLACRCAARSSAPASYQYTHTGFRIVMEVTE